MSKFLLSLVMGVAAFQVIRLGLCALSLDPSLAAVVAGMAASVVALVLCTVVLRPAAAPDPACEALAGPVAAAATAAGAIELAAGATRDRGEALGAQALDAAASTLDLAIDAGDIALDIALDAASSAGSATWDLLAD